MGDTPSTSDSASWTLTPSRTTTEHLTVATTVHVVAGNKGRANRLRVSDTKLYTVRATDGKTRIG